VHAGWAQVAPELLILAPVKWLSIDRAGTVTIGHEQYMRVAAGVGNSFVSRIRRPPLGRLFHHLASDLARFGAIFLHGTDAEFALSSMTPKALGPQKVLQGWIRTMGDTPGCHPCPVTRSVDYGR
jgi:hypothetical protein